MNDSAKQTVWQMEMRSLLADLPDDDPGEGAWRITRAEAMASRLVAEITLAVTDTYGPASVAAAMGISRQAMHQRLALARDRVADLSPQK